jgi:hypothetical protein
VVGDDILPGEIEVVYDCCGEVGLIGGVGLESVVDDSSLIDPAPVVTASSSTFPLPLSENLATSDDILDVNPDSSAVLVFKPSSDPLLLALLNPTPLDVEPVSLT